jgi:Flp pilus assembly protein TadG
MANPKKIKRNKGQSIVETAFILPIVVLILTGIVDFGLLFGNYFLVTGAAREAARLAVVGAKDTEIITAVQNITSTLDYTKLTIVIKPSEAVRKSGDEVTIEIGYDNELFTPVISSIIPNPLHIEGKTVMRME